MTKIAVFTVIATLGLQVVKADMMDTNKPVSDSKLPPGYTAVNVYLTILEQKAPSIGTNSVNFHFKKAQMNNNDLLGLVNNEFSNSFSVSSGDRLVVSNIWDGTFSVLSKSGSVLLANASTNTNGDHYHLYFHTSPPVKAGSENTNNASLLSVTDCHLYYESGDGTNRFHLEGFTTVEDVYRNNYSKNTESFQLSRGIGSLSFPDACTYGVMTGSVDGKGKDNAPVQ